MLNKKWLSFLLSFLVAVGLWVYVVTVENPVDEVEIYNIPVFFTGEDLLKEDYDLLLTETNANAGVTLVFSGKLSDLKKLQENKSDIQLNISITHLRAEQVYTLAYDISDVTLPLSVSAQDISLTQKDPNTVSVTLEKMITKSVDIRVQQNVDLEEGYMTGRLTQDLSQIVIEGPADAVGSVSYAQAILDRENVDQTITSSLPLTLVDENGEIVEDPNLIVSATEVEVSLPVLMYKDVPLEVAVIEGGGATEKDCAIEIEPKTIRLSGEPTELEAVQSIKLSNIDLSSLMSNNETLNRTIVVPEGCTAVSGEQEATVSVQIKNKDIRQLRVSNSNFQAIGLPADMNVEFKTTVLLVTIRANDKDIDKITEENIRVVADFSSMNLGSAMTVPVKIYVDGFTGAGVLAEEEYSILADVVVAAADNEE